jgi:SAM-dependent methyltransferase
MKSSSADLAQNIVFTRVADRLVNRSTGERLRLEGDKFVSPSSSFEVVRGVPRFVDSDVYVRSFSMEWNTHDRTQLDSFRGDNSSEEQFVKKTGFQRDAISGKLALDAGVGAGRYCDVISRWGADVVGVDLSYAVDAASMTFRDRKNVWIIQADIGNLPFADETFDCIFSIGVLHHTPDTKAYFMKLVPLLKKGGVIAIWVYPNTRVYLDRKAWVPFVNKIPPRMFYKWCRWFVPYLEKHIDNRLVGCIAKSFPYSHQGLGLENDILDTFDGLSPKYHGVHSSEEVRGWFVEAGLSNIFEPSSWLTCMQGTKP